MNFKIQKGKKENKKHLFIKKIPTHPFVKKTSIIVKIKRKVNFCDPTLVSQ